ncbi:MAG: hypothetical protein IPI60_00910 [Saprospiraceae bacterium]|nr:hypothetical protein [Saprospiraceae bacterium]
MYKFLLPIILVIISGYGLKAQNYSITTTATSITITDNSGNGDELVITGDAININIVSNPFRTYSLNGGLTMGFPVALPLAGITDITINGQAGADVFNFGLFSGAMPNLTVNGGTENDLVLFNQDITFLTNSNLNLDLQNDVAVPGTDRIDLRPGVNLILSGTGAATLRASRDIQMNIGSSIEVVNGNIIMEANQQAVPTAVDFVGIDVEGATIISTGSGSITVNGKGGNTSTYRHGVHVRSGGDIIGGNSGNVTINGTGGPTNFSVGIVVSGAGSTVSSTGANVSLTGLGGAGSQNNHGIIIDMGGLVTAGGNGAVSVTGTGGTGTGVFNTGIFLSGSSSQISSSGGSITMLGNGGGTGASTSNLGIYMLDADVSAGGPGNINIEGNAGSTGGGAIGVYISGATASVTSNSGSILIDGSGGGSGSSADNYGVFLDNGVDILSGGSGNVSIIGSAGLTSGNGNYGVLIEDASTTIITSGGNVSITGQGGGSGISGSNYGVVVRLAAQVSAGLSGTVMVTGTGGLSSTGGGSTGVVVDGVNSIITSSGGSVTVIGQGAGTGASAQNYGVWVNAGGRISSGGTGTVSVTGTGGLTSGIVNVGVYVLGLNSTITSAGGNVNIVGTGGGSGASAFNVGVLVQTNAFITVGGSGTLTIMGTGGINATSNLNLGVAIHTSGTITSLSNGNVIVTGIAGGSGGGMENNGVWVFGNSFISAGGGGTVTVNGTGGLSSGGFSHGVSVDGAGSTITSAGGSVSVTGNGGGILTAANNYGVLVQNAATISSGGTGLLTVNGTGGSTTGFFNYGVLVSGTNSRINSAGGNVSVTGNGGGTGISANNHGVYLINAALISAGATGTVTVLGQGGANTGDSNYGVFLEQSSANITSSGGNVSVTGNGGGSSASSFNYGVYVYSSAFISAGLNGTVTVAGTGGNTTGNFNLGVYLSLLNTRITSTNGNVSVTGTANGTGVSANNRGIWVQSTAFISAGGNGNLTVIGNGGLNANGNNNHGVHIDNASATISSNNGNINITGIAGGTGTSANNVGVFAESSGRISAGGTGDVTINGTGGLGMGGNNRGVSIFNANSFVQTANGDINVTGTGGGTGPGADNAGVNVSGSANIIAGGTGTVFVEGFGGTGGSGNSNVGVLVSDAMSIISSTNGNVDVIGTGGGAGASVTNAGVFVLGLATVSAGGSGLLNIHGTGGGSNGTGNVGVLMVGSPVTITSGGGNISITGVEGNGIPTLGIFTTGTVITTATNGGDILLVANSIDLSAATVISTNLVSSVTILPLTANVQIDLGSALNPIGGPLSLSDVELDLITTGTLIIGDVNTGAITVSTNITRTGLTNVELYSADDINVSGGGINTAGGTLLLDAGDSPATINPTFIGTDASISTLTLAGDLSIVINGTTPDTDYTQLTVAGSVNLNGVNLVISGTHVPTFGESFIIVDNDGVDPIIGTFAGLPEGAVISNFMGTLWSAMISYVGGDLNDVELTVFAPCPGGNHYFVDVDATGSNDGTSWANAFNDLQDALFLVVGCPLVTEIWVAEGTYYPTPGTDRTVSFSMRNNLAIYGGFDGTETLLSERDWATNVTILSGDIGIGNDSTDNSYHLISNLNLDNTAILDGFTITAGNADGVAPNDRGAGLYNVSADITLSHCIFEANAALNGAGIFNQQSDINVDSCSFITNTTFPNGFGGGMYNSSSNLTISNSNFDNNSAGWGGAINIHADAGFTSNHNITNSTFSNNLGTGGGGAINNGLPGSAGTALFNCIKCQFIDNISYDGATIGGGGAYFSEEIGFNGYFENNLFDGNQGLGAADWGGGAFLIFRGIATIVNSTLVNNISATDGGAISIYSPTGSVIVRNSILWDNAAANQPSIYNGQGGSASIEYSLIQDAACPPVVTCGAGMIYNIDPLFVNEIGGDYRLQACSPAVDAGTTTGAPADDLDGNPRPMNAGIDMGAYEYQGALTPTIALCQNQSVYLDSLGSATVLAEDVDNGSSGCAPLTFEIDGEPSIVFDCDETGDNVITMTVTNSLGQQNSCTATITVIDSISPILSPAMDMTVECNDDTNGTSLQSWLDIQGGATATDNCATITWTNALMDEVPGCGNTTCYTYNFIATDASDNSSSSTAMFCVVDTTAPIAVCRTDTVTIESNGTYFFTAEDVLNTDLSSDNCGTVTVTDISPASVDCEDMNQYVLVTVTVSDECGNTSQCTANMYVEVGEGLPSEWESSHVGTGSGDSEFDPCEEDGVFTISSTGFAFGTSDSQQFVHQTICGDGSIIAKVTSISGGGWAGVQIRETLAAGSKKAALKTQLTNHVRREIRATTNGMVQSQTITALNRPWIRLVRVGNTFTGYHSTNGINWQFAFSATVAMNSCVEIGLIVESINSSTVTTATFESVEVIGGNPLRPVANIASELTNASDVILFPNPTNGQLNIDLRTHAGKYSKFHVVNALGQIVDTKELSLDRFYYFDLNLVPGMYTVIFEENGTIKGNNRLIVH